VGKLLASRRSTNYLCYVPVLEDSKGAGRARLTRFAVAKVYKIFILPPAALIFLDILTIRYYPLDAHGINLTP